jgi:ABC-type xylose transport system permease subunit
MRGGNVEMLRIALCWLTLGVCTAAALAVFLRLHVRVGRGSAATFARSRMGLPSYFVSALAGLLCARGLWILLSHGRPITPGHSFTEPPFLTAVLALIIGGVPWAAAVFTAGKAAGKREAAS